MTDTNKTSGVPCAHNWHDSSDKPGTVWCNRCKMVSAAGREGVPYVAPSGADVLALLDRCAEIMHDDAAPAMQDADIAADLRSGAVDLIAARTAVAALIERNAELEAQTPSALRDKLRSCEEALQASESERDALAAEVKALREDAERLDWLDSQEADVRFHRDHELAGDGEYLIMVQIVSGDKSISGHPLGYVRDAIDAARASAATGGGNA